MKKTLRRGLKYLDRLTGPGSARFRTEAVFEPTEAVLHRALPPVRPGVDAEARLRALLMQRAIAMRARRAWYRTREALVGAVAVGVAGAAGLALLAWHVRAGQSRSAD